MLRWINPSLAITCFVLASIEIAFASTEPLELRLIRAVHTRILDAVSADEVRGFADNSGTFFEGYALARAALIATGDNTGWPEWPLERVLDKALTQFQGSSRSLGDVTGILEGFGSEDLVFLLTYTLVTNGETENAISVLTTHSKLGGPYKRSVALQALRMIGTQNADAVIQQQYESKEPSNVTNICHNLQHDLHFPFFTEVAKYQKHAQLKPERKTAVSTLNSGCLANPLCNELIAAAHFLGFVSDANTSQEQELEIAALKKATGNGHFQTRYAAVRALALRSRETITFWKSLFQNEPTLWIRTLIARIGFIHFEKEFVPTALELLGNEPAQFVEWELMHGISAIADGTKLRDYWDLYFGHNLQLRLNYPSTQTDLKTKQAEVTEQTLAWLETGARPHDSWVRAHLMFLVIRNAQRQQIRRILKVYASLPERKNHSWVLTNITYPEVLPILRYWQKKTPGDFDIGHAIHNLEVRRDELYRLQSEACCQPNRECLLKLVETAATLAPEPIIASDEEEQRWLGDTTSNSLAEARYEVEFTDKLARVAAVREKHSPIVQHWEHIYGCWKRVDK